MREHIAESLEFTFFNLFENRDFLATLFGRFSHLYNITFKILKQTYNFNDVSVKTLSILHIKNSAETTTVNLLDHDEAVVDYGWKLVGLFLEFESYFLSDG